MSSVPSDDESEDVGVTQEEFRDRIGKETKEMKLAAETREQYKRKLDKMKGWLIENHIECLESVEDPVTDDLTDVANYNISLPLPDVVVESFMSHCLLKIDARTGEYFDPPRFYSFQHVNGYRSALKHLYREQGMRASDDVEHVLKETMDGFKRRIALLKEDGMMPQTEGKQPMSVQGFHFLAKKSMTEDHDFKLYSFCHTFLLLCWNLLARAVTVSAVMYDHISWEGDAMTIKVSRMKNDQEGVKAYPRHIYANPLNPILCPILSIAILIFTKGFQREGSDRLIFGNKKCARDRFSKWLLGILRDCALVIVSMGLIVSEIGSHSFRKGIATSLANTPGGPTAINIWLRAGWSLGAVQSRYIFEGPGGDQFVGRAATGLSLDDENFAILPPHFDTNCGPVLTVEEWENILPGFSEFYPQTFRVALPFFLASLAYHRKWMVENLPRNHPIFFSRVMTSGTLEELESKVETGLFMNRKTGLKASGVPRDVILAFRMTKMEDRFNTFEETVVNEIRTVPKESAREILKNCEVTGAVPITSSEVTCLLDGLKTSILGEIRELNARGAASRSTDNRLRRRDGICEGDCEYIWGDRRHVVPQGFQLVTGNVRMMWDLWWDGQPHEKIGPYRYIRSWSLIIKKDKGLLSKCAKIMNTMTDWAIETNLVSDADEISDMQLHDRDILFSECFIHLSKLVLDVDNVFELDKRKVGDMSYCRLYDLLQKTLRRR